MNDAAKKVASTAGAKGAKVKKEAKSLPDVTPAGQSMAELDAMLATLDLVARSDWVTVVPGIMMALDTGSPPLKVNPLTGPPLSLDLVMIEPSRRSLSDIARAFLAALEAQAQRLNLRWSALPPAAAPSKKPARAR